MSITPAFTAYDSTKENDIKPSGNLEDALKIYIQKGLSHYIKDASRELPLRPSNNFPAWVELEEEMRRLVHIIYRLTKHKDFINHYLGGQSDQLKQQIYEFLLDNNLNPCAIPTISELGKIKGGFALVKTIANAGGLKSIRKDYIPWAVKRIENQDENQMPTQMRLLDGIGERNLFTINWPQMLNEVNNFISENGHSNIPISHPLGRWVREQRHLYRKGQLRHDQVVELETIGFVWSPIEEKWETNYQNLKDYLAGKASMNSKLHTWINMQRLKHKKLHLSEEKVQKLEQLKNWSWHKNFGRS